MNSCNNIVPFTPYSLLSLSVSNVKEISFLIIVVGKWMFIQEVHKIQKRWKSRSLTVSWSDQEVGL